MRRDLNPLRPGDEATVELKLFTARRTALVCGRTRVINRLGGALTGTFPALERVLDLTNSGPLVLLAGYQTPAAIRRMGASRLETWLCNRKVRSAATLARTALDAAEQQHTIVVAEKAIAQMVQTEVISLNEKIAEVDKLIKSRFRQHEPAPAITSLPGIGPLLGAEFLAANHGDLAFFASSDRLAGFAGLAPAPRDSGRVSGNLHRPKRYHRGLQRVFYTSALISTCNCAASRRFYDRKGAEGKRHTQALLALVSSPSLGAGIEGSSSP